MPDRSSGERIERPGMIGRAGDVQQATKDQRARFDLAKDTGLTDPLRREAGDIPRVDLGEVTVAPSQGIFSVCDPIAGVRLGVEQKRDAQENQAVSELHFSPLKVVRYRSRSFNSASENSCP